MNGAYSHEEKANITAFINWGTFFGLKLDMGVLEKLSRGPYLIKCNENLYKYVKGSLAQHGFNDLSLLVNYVGVNIGNKFSSIQGKIYRDLMILFTRILKPLPAHPRKLSDPFSFFLFTQTIQVTSIVLTIWK